MKRTWIAWGVAMLICVAFVILIKYFFPVPRILNVEFATTRQYMLEHILAGQSSQEVAFNTLKMNTILDFGFIIGYSLLTFFSLKIILDVFQLTLRNWVYVIAFTAGVFDVLENIFLIHVATTGLTEPSLFFIWVVRLKWATAIVPLLVIPVVLVYSLIILLRTRQ
ncbi:MAG: hypothetical protein ABI675_30045 [Chitinophagaceae bacterium]